MESRPGTHCADPLTTPDYYPRRFVSPGVGNSPAISRIKRRSPLRFGVVPALPPRGGSRSESAHVSPRRVKFIRRPIKSSSPPPRFLARSSRDSSRSTPPRTAGRPRRMRVVKGLKGIAGCRWHGIEEYVSRRTPLVKNLDSWLAAADVGIYGSRLPVSYAPVLSRRDRATPSACGYRVTPRR